jgi:AmmeMemoRadiSam system protein B
MSTDRFPKLRPVDVRSILQGGRPFLLLRDPLQLSEQSLLVPQELAPVLGLIDGTRDGRALSASLALRYGLRVSSEMLEELFVVMDQAYLLENDHYQDRWRQALDEFRQAPFRPPASAGESYPVEVDALEQMLDGYMGAVVGGEWEEEAHPPVRGLVSPHIDFQRGGTVYARVWGRASEVAREADLVVILGTDHYSDDDCLINLTRQNYATPYGVLPTATAAVENVTSVLGEDAAFSGELRHRSEHSIELAAVWLHYIREGNPCELLPILCGSFIQYLRGEAVLAEDIVLQDVLKAIHQATRGRRVLYVAAGDLAHVGPAFGGRPLDFASRARLKAADRQLIEYICALDSGAFYQAVHAVEDRNNVCGLAPIYMTMRLLEGATGERVAYDLCPADHNGTSVVSVCGVVFW